MNGFTWVPILKVWYFWQCHNGCPVDAFLSDNVVFDAVGMTSGVCFHPPAAEETTWGRVKALYD